LKIDVTAAVKPIGFVGRRFQFVVDDRQGVGKQAVDKESVGGGGEQLGVIGMASQLVFEDSGAAGVVIFLEIGNGGDDGQLILVRICEREPFGMVQRQFQGRE